VFQILSAPLTDTGRKRQHNEDWTVQFEPPTLEERAQSGCLYIVADGVGGAAHGERASQYASQKVLYDYYHRLELPPAERLAEAMRQAGNEIYQYAEEQGQGRMATTMVAAVVLGSKLIVANVGDSRAYLLRDGVAHQITRDHSLVGEMIRDGSLTEEESLHSKVKNSLTRSLGGERDTHVDLFELDLQTGDRLLLSTDGLLRYTTRREITAMLSSGTPREAAEHMLNYALEQGGADNITVLPIEIGPPLEEGFAAALKAGQMPAPADWELMTTEPVAPSASITRPRARRKRCKQSNIMYALFGGVALLALVAVIVFLVMPPTKVKTPVVGSSSPSPETTLVGETIAAIVDITASSTETPTVTPTYTAVPTLSTVPTITNTPLPTPTGDLLVQCVYTVDLDKIRADYDREFRDKCDYGSGPGWLDVYCIATLILNKQLSDLSMETYLETITCKDSLTCSYISGNHDSHDGDVLIFPEIYQTDCKDAGGEIYDGTK
jgi:protein phosphatase